MDDEEERHEPRRSLGRRILYGFSLLVLVGGIGVWAGYTFWSASEDLRDAQDLIEVAATSLKDGDINRARDALNDAQDLIVGANGTLHDSAAIDVVSLFPILSDNVDAIEDSIDLALTVVYGAGRILDEATPLESEGGTLEVSLADGTLPIAAVTEARQEISALLVQLITSSEPRDSSFLIRPVRELRESVIEEAEERRAQLQVLDSGLELLEEFSGSVQPRRYLLAVANTAEMRGTGGMILNYGVLDGRDGTIDLTAFGRVDDIALSGPVSEELVPADYLARWNGFDQLRRWRQANLAGDFTVVAPVLEAMFTSATGLPVDGVIQVDPQGLAAILTGVGPVQIPEVGEVNADNVVALTMHQAYVQFPGVEDRTDVLGDVAEAAFRKLVDGDVPSLRTLATAIAEAVDGRHIIAHASSETIQREFVEFGADGDLPSFDGPDSFSLTAQNLSGNKLDYFLDTSVEVTGERLAGEIGEVSARVTLTNTAPAGVAEPRYVYGPGFTEESPPAGVLRSLVTLYLPVGSTLEESSGDTPIEPVSNGTEADRPYVAFTVDVPASDSRTIDLSLRLAPRSPGGYEVQFVPSPRIRPTTATVDLNLGGGRLQGQVALDRTWSFRTEGGPVALVAPIYQLPVDN